MILNTFLRINKLHKLNLCTKTAPNKLYSNTLMLPKTTFPLRLENKKLIERDDEFSSAADFNQLYTWQRFHLNEPEYVLHDGPPYANGKLHMGHAINKILKDTILRYQILKGTKVHYVPGWDCHGLPIELKALSNNHNLSSLEIRKKARNFARETVDQQKQAFKSWGIMGDWNNSYTTYDPNYVKTQFRIFHKLYMKNLIYRDFKPIHWSPSSKTALAEAELEYNENHKSPSAFIRVELKNLPGNSSYNDKIYALIWTTTPWTLPSNQAICYNPTLKYSLTKSSKDNCLYIIGTDLIEKLQKTLNCTLEIVDSLSIEELSKSSYIHPIYKEKILNFIPASHATATKGTGLVHTAPAHGPDDFLIALTNKMPIVNLVNELGCYNEQAGENLEGKFVLKEGTDAVMDMIKNDLVHLEDFIHSYPYDWRTKEPVIIRASQQWFFDTNSIKSRAIELLDNVEIIPKSGSEVYKRNLIDQIQKRPYWCISRQRKWGVPIPVFYNTKSGEIILNEDLTRHCCDLLDKYGTDFWWTLPVGDLLPMEIKNELNLNEIEKGEDILDIWFDSGISWAFALDGTKVARMYLEGVDQLTGWFQSSLITSVGLRDKAPYEMIYIHGFAVDEKGAKMSKSLGNIIDPENVLRGMKNQKPFGIDALRWWVACHASQNSIAHISENVLKSSAEEVQKVRSVLRFALGALYDYSNRQFRYENLTILDKYMLHLLANFHKQINEAIDNYQFNKICILVVNLLTNPVSALYYTAIKDRLYCDHANSETRRMAQYVLFQIFDIVSSAVAPIVPHLAEEMYLHLPIKSGKTFFTSTHVDVDEKWNNTTIEKLFDFILSVKKDVNKKITTGTLSSIIILKVPTNIMKEILTSSRIDDFQNEMEDILQVSQVFVEETTETCYTLEINESKLFSCLRCRRVQSNLENELCGRCEQIVTNNKTAVVN